MSNEEFIVTWSMPIEGEGPIDAARQALGILQDPYNIATVFIVVDPDGRRLRVDLDPALDPDEYEAVELPAVDPVAEIRKARKILRKETD